jgi:AcrR family transcriptional regulator
VRIRLFTSLALIILSSLLFSIPAWANEEYLKAYTLVADNEYLQLYINEETTEVAVLEKTTNHVWFSNPQNLSMERIKRGAARDGLRATFSLSYYTPEREARTLNSYLDSVLNGEFTITPVDGGVRIDYTLGQQWKPEAYTPIMIAKDKFEAVLERVEDKLDRQILEEDYTLLTLTETAGDPYERVAVYGVDTQRVFGSWDLQALSGPVLKKSLGLRDSPEERKKYLIERLADTIIEYRADMDMRNLITASDVSHLKNAEVYALLEATYPRFDKPEIARIFKEAGYGPEDVAADHTAASLDPPIPNPEVFGIPVIFRLDGPSLVATIPAGEITYPIDALTKDGSIATFMPQSMDLLPLFGAADTRAEGYLFVADRSGALVKLNNQKKLSLPSFSGNVYGTDRSIQPQYEQITAGPLIRMPVYGLKEGDKAFFTIIEDGQAIAVIRAELAGKTDSFNKAWVALNLTPRATITLYGVREEGQITSSDDRLVDVYQARPYNGNVTLRITFLTGDDADYAGMARLYRSYLIDRHGLKRIPPDSPLPFYVELIGGIHRRSVFLGAPREVVEPLTSYAQARGILDELVGSGVSGIKARYTGWTEGGIHHYFPSRVSPERALGTRADLDQLIQFAAEHGIEIYPDVDFITVYRDTLFDAYRSGRDASRYLNRSAVKVYEFNIATFQRIPERGYEILSAGRLEGLVNSFLKSFGEFGFEGVSLRSIASAVFSDFREKPEDLLDRQQAVVAAQRAIGTLRAAGLKVMVEGGNDMAFPYASHIVDAPTGGTRLHLFDESVPFYQMVLHGYIDYAGAPFNYRGDYDEVVLRCLETGEAPYYRWSYADSSVVKDTLFNHLLSIEYRGWFDDAVALYHEISSVLDRVRGQAIVNHEKLDEGVYRTTYENGFAVVVNYTDEDYSHNGVAVAAKSYSVLEREREL